VPVAFEPIEPDRPYVAVPDGDPAKRAESIGRIGAAK